MTATMITYYLAEHPTIVGFRWSHSQSWGSTWSFLISALAIYLLSALFLHSVLLLFGRRRPVPLGPIPTLHSFLMSSTSAAIFLGLLLSSYAEIRDTRWFWRRTRITSPLQWLLCFPLGTRPTGCVFFWSYAFYLSRFLHLFRTFVFVLRRRPHVLSSMFGHVALVCVSFLWLNGVLLMLLLNFYVKRAVRQMKGLPESDDDRGACVGGQRS